MATATQAVPSTAATVITESMQRLVQVRDLWTRSQKDQLEIGRLLYEERKERLSVGGRGIHEGFAQWLREAGIPHKSAYRRIAEYEVSIGERTEPEEKPVSTDTTLAPEPQASTWDRANEKRKHRDAAHDFEELRALSLRALKIGFKQLWKAQNKNRYTVLASAKKWSIAELSQ